MSGRRSYLVMDLYHRCFQHSVSVGVFLLRAAILKSDDLSFTQIKMLLQMVGKKKKAHRDQHSLEARDPTSFAPDVY